MKEEQGKKLALIALILMLKELDNKEIDAAFLLAELSATGRIF